MSPSNQQKKSLQLLSQLCGHCVKQQLACRRVVAQQFHAVQNLELRTFARKKVFTSILLLTSAELVGVHNRAKVADELPFAAAVDRLAKATRTLELARTVLGVLIKIRRY